MLHELHQAAFKKLSDNVGVVYTVTSDIKHKNQQEESIVSVICGEKKN